MKSARKTCKAILAVLLVGVVISVSSWAFAQGGGIGYAAAGNVTQAGERDYHYGVASSWATGPCST